MTYDYVVNWIKATLSRVGVADITLIWSKLKKKVYLRVNGVLIYLSNNLRFSYYALDTKSENVIYHLVLLLDVLSKYREMNSMFK